MFLHAKITSGWTTYKQKPFDKKATRENDKLTSCFTCVAHIRQTTSIISSIEYVACWKRTRGRAGDRLLSLNTGKIDHNSIELTKRLFLHWQIFMRVNKSRAVFALSGFSVSKYQIADKLHCIMQLAHCCEIFDIFIFILVLHAKLNPRWIYQLMFSIRRVFAGVSLFVFNSRFCYTCIWCAQNAVPRDAAGKRNRWKNVGKRQQQVRQF